jgi:hypothetical protein
MTHIDESTVPKSEALFLKAIQSQTFKKTLKCEFFSPIKFKGKLYLKFKGPAIGQSDPEMGK